MTRQDTLNIVANIDNLDEVIEWMDELLMSCGYNGSARVQLDIAVEEIYVNIAHYAYETEGGGSAKITITVEDDPLRATVRFEDSGRPYDPLSREEPDITLSAKERRIGGLGIFMTKKSMDHMNYEYRKGKNILTIVKNYVSD